MDKAEAAAFARAFVEATGLTAEDIFSTPSVAEPDIDTLLPRRQWVPKYSSTYFYITDQGCPAGRQWSNDSTDNMRLSNGNVFKTFEDADEHANNMRAWTDLRARSNCECNNTAGYPVWSSSGSAVPGAMFRSEADRTAAVNAVGGSARIDSLARWIFRSAAQGSNVDG